MTVATKQSLGGAKAKDAAPAKAPKQRAPRVGSPWRRLWQVPLLLIGLGVFVWGLKTLVKTFRQVPFEQQATGIRYLIKKEDFNTAIEQINIQAEFYQLPAQQGELQTLAADAIFLAERKLESDGKFVRKNYESAADHYRKAALWGITQTVEENERWGESALAIGDGALAVEKLEAAIKGGQETEGGTAAADLLRKHGKDLVAAYLDANHADMALETIDRMLSVIPSGAGIDQEAIEERTWCLCKRIEIALAGTGKNGLPNGKAALEKAMASARAEVGSLSDRNAAGRVLSWIGRVELEQGNVDVAEKELQEARRDFAIKHLDDGRAALLLAGIAEAKSDYDTAGKLYQEIVTAHAGTTLWPAARLGRAEVLMRKGTPLNDTSLADYRFAVATIKEGGQKRPIGQDPELMTEAGVLASLADGFKRASAADRLPEALTFLGLRQEVGLRETPDLALSLATTREKLAAEMQKEASKLEGQPQAAREAEVRNLLSSSADDYLRHAKMTTLKDDQSGASLWKAGELLDRAGETMRAIEVFRQIMIQRPRDPHVSEAMLSLGRLYESAGLVDQAVEVYERNIKENPKTPATYTSVVNLARCYVKIGEKAEKPEEKAKLFGKAEAGLLALVQENAGLEPTAREFRDALMALSDLYFQDGRWADAILRLDESLSRYSSDTTWEAMPRAAFMLAESYRRSAAEIKAALADPSINQRAELNKARLERLTLAAHQFSRVIAMLDVEAMDDGAAQGKKITVLESTYLRTSYIDRAECSMERGDYDEAINLYDRAAARFSDEVIAVQAYVQIVNAYLALKQPQQASEAAERGRWLLNRMPETAFANARNGLNRAYFEKLLALGKT